MPNVTDIVRMRQRRQREAQARPARRLGRWGLIVIILLSLGLALAAVGATLFYTRWTEDLPSVELFPRLLDPEEGYLRAPTTFTDRNGETTIYTMAHPAANGARALPLTASDGEPHLPDALVEATLAVADRDYSLNPGSDFAPQSLAEKLVVDLALWDEPKGLRRAFRARLLAAQLTHRFGREQVLEWSEQPLWELWQQT